MRSKNYVYESAFVDRKLEREIILLSTPVLEKLKMSLAERASIVNNKV